MFEQQRLGEVNCIAAAHDSSLLRDYVVKLPDRVEGAISRD